MSKTMASAARLILAALSMSLGAQGSSIADEWFASPLRLVDLKKGTTLAPASTEGDVAMIMLDPEDIDIVHPANIEVNVTMRYPQHWDVNITFASTPRWITTHPDVITLYEKDYEGEDLRSLLLTLNTTRNGKATVEVMLEHNGTRHWNAWLRLAVQMSPALTTTADVLGWIYTIAWDASFLPQIIHNWKRRSVAGLSFDFLLFNLLGFLTYFIFNAGLLWIPEIRAQYFDRHPSGVIHVRLNDVFFPLYALVCTLVQILQCFILKRSEGQRISTTCWIVAGLMIASLVASSIAVAAVPSFLWLDALYFFSYIKVTTTAIKYVPQLVLNYKSKSTAGWSIWMVALDFIGGLFSIIQMCLLAINYDNWYSILTDPAKMGLGLLSMLFNVLFFIQHFCIYRDEPKPVEENDSVKAKNFDVMTKF